MKAALVVLAAVLAAAASGCATLDRDDLANHAETLRSAAAEGVLLAQEAEGGRAPTSYVWIHSAELRKQAEEVIAQIDGPVIEEGHGPEAARMDRIAREIAGDLDHLHRLANNEYAARRVAQDLQLQVVNTRLLLQDLS